MNSEVNDYQKMLELGILAVNNYSVFQSIFKLPQYMDYEFI